MHSKRSGLNLSNIIAVFLGIAIIGCSKNAHEKTPVARIDNQMLALEEIRSHLDTSGEPSDAQLQQYVQRWLTEESLYREAVDRGLDRTEEMNQKVEDVRRQLAINALLDKEVYSRQAADFSAQDIRQYYDSHIKEFINLHDVAQVSAVLFKTRDAATEFRNRVLKGAAWNSALNEMLPSVVMKIDSSYRTEETLLPAELWRVASKSNAKELSFPINTSKGYYILVVWKYSKQGQTAELPLVEKEIRGRLTVERRRELYDQLVQNLRAKHAIQVFISSAPDSGKSKTKE